MKLLLVCATIAAASINPTASWAETDKWSGPYVGASADAVFDDTTIEDMGCWTSCSSISLRKASASATVSAGYDVQVTDDLVMGIVADFGSGNERRTLVGDGLPVSTTGTITHSSKIAERMSLRGRAGVTFGNSLIYLSGGIARAKVTHRVQGEGVPSYSPSHSADFDATWSGYNNGLIYGIGVERKIGALSAKVEVVSTHYATKAACFSNSTGSDIGQCWPTHYVIPPQVNFNSTSAQIRVGVNWRF